MRTTFKVAGLALLALSGLLFSLAFGVSTGYAAPTAQSAQVLTIPAGQTATIHLRVFCIDPGKPFPTSITNPTGVADEAVRSGLVYAVSKGYPDSDPRQTQQAVWYLQTGTWQKADHARGQEIADAAKDPANKATDPTGATSLIDAIKNNMVSATLSVTPPSETTIDLASYGSGTLAVKNTGSSEIQVFLPFGTVFPPVDASQQRMVGYAATVDQAPTLTPAPTNTVAPTATTAPQPTATAAPQPTATAVAPNVPKTGAGNGNSWAIVLFSAGLLTMLAGIVLLRRRTTSDA